MDLIERLILAILGTCILLYLGWVIYLLRAHPRALLFVNSKPVTFLDKVHQKLI